MPPENPSFLAILDLTEGPQGVSGRVEYAEPTAPRDCVRVRWGAGLPPAGFVPMVDGVVFVADRDPLSREPDHDPSLSVIEEHFEYAEAFGPSPGWMMLVVLLPQGYELKDPTPRPAGSRLHVDRVALYWRVSKPPPGEPQMAQVSGRLRRSKDVRTALGEPLAHEVGFDPEERPDHQIFLSYRRKDDRWAAGRIRECLSDALGPGAVFRDLESIHLGQDFRDSIDSAVGRCKMVLVLIGPNWLDPGTPRGERRVDRAVDWPRLEIEFALQRKRLLVPVFLDCEEGLDANLLPESIRELAYRQGFRLNEDRFESERALFMERIIESLARTSP